MSFIPAIVSKTLEVADIRAKFLRNSRDDRTYLVAYLSCYRTWFKETSKTHSPSWMSFITTLVDFETFTEVEHVIARLTPEVAEEIVLVTADAVHYYLVIKQVPGTEETLCFQQLERHIRVVEHLLFPRCQDVRAIYSDFVACKTQFANLSHSRTVAMSGEPSVTRSEHLTQVFEEAFTEETSSTEKFRRSSSVASTDSTDSFSPPGLGTYKYQSGHLEADSSRPQTQAVGIVLVDTPSTELRRSLSVASTDSTDSFSPPGLGTYKYQPGYFEADSTKPQTHAVPLVLVQEHPSSESGHGASSVSTPSSEPCRSRGQSIPSQEYSINGLAVYKRTSNLRERPVLDSVVPTSPSTRQHIQHPFEPRTPTRDPRKRVDNMLIGSSPMQPINYGPRPVDSTPTKDPRKRPVESGPISSSPRQPINYGPRPVDSTPTKTKDPRKRPVESGPISSSPMQPISYGQRSVDSTPTKDPRKRPVDSGPISSSPMQSSYHGQRSVDSTPTKDPRKRPVDSGYVGSSPMQPIYYGQRSVDSTPTKDPRKRPISDSVPMSSSLASSSSQRPVEFRTPTKDPRKRPSHDIMQTISPSVLQWNQLCFVSPKRPVRSQFGIIPEYRPGSEGPQTPNEPPPGGLESDEAPKVPLPPTENDQRPVETPREPPRGSVESGKAPNVPLPPIENDQRPVETPTNIPIPVRRRPKPYSRPATSSSTPPRVRMRGAHTVDRDRSSRYPEIRTPTKERRKQ